ncbi:MAG: hypothetical protein F9K24_18610 [Leptonema illini]|uniref:Phorbol-ester/DAG-type domain-containing protein n=1 Tax=Leptonema illini TaxID=183 RepID=A0A833GY74_9LEPT|nr:MAG: hypothetical protein F9K24_18610 [Leptonema illini]
MIINETDGKVKINDFVLEGFISDTTCKQCGKFEIYFDDYDSFFCPYCNAWTEESCQDPFCKYCSNRPGKPINENW